MHIKEKLKIPCSIAVAVTTIAITFYTVIELMAFLSDPHYKHQVPSKGNFWVNASLSLFVNQLLLSAFILQHSFLALPSVKSWFSTLKIAVIQRSLYVVTTSIALQLVMKYWRAIPEFMLWNINTNFRMYWWGFLLLHVLAWTIIYVGTICMDINELLGIKQIYYNLRKLPDPSEYKSTDLKRLYLHMRHPSFVGFLVIFWAIPFMSLDRLLLASVLTAYMYLAWNTDESDYRYQKWQTEKKVYELNCLK